VGEFEVAIGEEFFKQRIDGACGWSARWFSGSWLFCHVGFLGSDANFIAMQSIAPGGRAKGTMNLDSDPDNPIVTASC